MSKKIIFSIVMALAFVVIFYIIIVALSSKSANAPSTINNNEVEQRIFKGPSGLPFVKGPTSSAPNY
ncbi:MAG: hypothetical protein QMD65_03135 [Patescibacteria group bacterium]|nr:hypothetical protein [Patescibacteria group bacterium]